MNINGLSPVVMKMPIGFPSAKITVIYKNFKSIYKIIIFLKIQLRFNDAIQ